MRHVRRAAILAPALAGVALAVAGGAADVAAGWPAPGPMALPTASGATAIPGAHGPWRAHAVADRARPGAPGPDRAPPAPDQAATWVLDRFYVVFFDYGATSRGEVRDTGSRAFAFGGDYSVPGGNAYQARGRLSVNVPDRIASGGDYAVDGRVAGDIAIQGTVPAAGERAAVEVSGLCWYDDRSGKQGAETRILPGTPSASLDAAFPALDLTAPAILDPTTPASHNCEFAATLSVGLAVAWRVTLQAQYKQQAATAPGLDLDADTTRLPPSGAQPSTAAIVATVRDGAGRPVTGAPIDFTLDPPDMGRLQPARGTTDAQGIVRTRFTAPAIGELRGRTGVTVRARAPGRGLERGLHIGIEPYRLSAAVEPDQLPVRDPPGTARLRLVAERFDGRPAAGDVVALRLDPPDMGRLLGDTLLEDRVLTDAQGVAEVFYEAPPPAAMRQRDRVAVHAVNLSHGGEAAAAIRFVGLRVTGAQPPEGARDVALAPGGGVILQLDRAVDPASVGPGTVQVQTLWHGDLAAEARAVGDAIHVRVTQDPVPDVGLVATVRLVGGANGVRGMDGHLMLGDFTLRFMTMPRLAPRIIVSQVVDDPRDPTYGVVSAAPKPFVLRVAGGLSADSELTAEQATVTLTTPAGGEQTVDHTYYPGDWPPRVPAAVVKRGNTANFVVDPGLRAGAFAVTASVRPFFAPDDRAVSAAPVTISLNRWRNARAANGLGVLFVPLQNDHLPGYAWNISRHELARWVAQLGAEAPRYLPLRSMAPRLGFFEDTTCHDPDRCQFERHPWTELDHWARHVGRAGYATPWSYVFPVVPRGWFAARFADHPDVVANPDRYHNMINNGLWSDVAVAGIARQSPSMSPILQADASAAAFVHALGDAIGRPHAGGARDALAGYDLEADQAIAADGAGWTGAYVSLMSLDVGFGSEWTGRADYEAFLDRWTEKACVGVPPCPASGLAAGPAIAAGASTGDGGSALSLGALPGGPRGDHPAGQPIDPSTGPSTGPLAGPTTDQPVDPTADPAGGPIVVVSGTIRRGSGESAVLDPLIWTEGVPTLAAEGDAGYAVVLSDAGGAPLARHAFAPAFGPVDGGELAGFLAAVPRPADAAAVATVAVLHGDAVIGTLRRSANAPAVDIVRPAAGSTGRGTIDAAWTGRDADGDALTYTVLFSGDGGQVWLPLRIDGDEPSLALPGDDLPNGPDARLRVVASDGFNTGAAEARFRLDGGQRVLATVPEDGARGVSPLTDVRAVVRDPLATDRLGAGAFQLRGPGGEAVPGALTYDPTSGTLQFDPAAPLLAARTYEARLTTGAVTPDGRALPADVVWRFATRGETIHLPRVARGAPDGPVAGAPTPTPGPTRPRRPTPAPGPTYTPGLASATPTGGAPVTPAASATAVATPGPTATRLPSPPTPPASVPVPASATPTAGASPAVSPPAPPTATPSPDLPPPTTGVPTASPTAFLGVMAIGALTTGTDPARLRQAFAPGEPIHLFVGTRNGTGAPVTAAVEFTVVGDNGVAPDALAWRGSLQVPPGEEWFRLERAVPADLPAGPYRLLGTVSHAGRATTATGDFFVAGSLQRHDGFDDPASGWTTHDDADVHSGYLAGAFQILIRTAGIWRFDTPRLAATDFAMEADVAFAGDAAGAAGLVTGISADGQAWLNFVVARDGRYGLFRRGGGAWQTVVPLTESAAIDRAANHMLVARQGDTVRLYANGQLLAVVEERTATGGMVALYAEAVSAGLDARFDEFRLYRAPRGDLAAGRPGVHPLGVERGWGGNPARIPGFAWYPRGGRP